MCIGHNSPRTLNAFSRGVERMDLVMSSDSTRRSINTTRWFRICSNFVARQDFARHKSILARFAHRRTHDLQTYVQRPWLIVSVNLGYSFNVHAWLPLRVAMSQHCEESFETLEARSLVSLLRGFIQCASIQVIIARSITASVHKFGAVSMTMGLHRALCPLHTESVNFVPHKSSRARCA